MELTHPLLCLLDWFQALNKKVFWFYYLKYALNTTPTSFSLAHLSWFLAEIWTDLWLFWQVILGRQTFSLGMISSGYLVEKGM